MCVADCSAELGMDWRGNGGWEACRSYPAGPGGPPTMNGVVHRRQMMTGATGYGTSIKQEYARAIPAKYVTSPHLSYFLSASICCRQST